MTKPVKVSASVQATVVVVCPHCGQAIEVSLESWSNYKGK